MNLNKVPLVIAHRGSGGVNAPENTIKACKLALENGATALEIDIRPTREGNIILFHDSLLLRHFGKPIPVPFCSLKELKKLEFSKKSYEHQDRICTLGDFFEEFKNTVPINLDSKTMWSNYWPFAKSLIREIEQFDIADQVWISSFNPVFLKLIKMFKPELRTGFLFRNLAFVNRYIDIISQADAWHPHHSVISDRFYELTKKLKKEIYVWTINEELILERILKYNFEGIITDTLYKDFQARFSY
jgi:glycerophosphoryl diester phosphodiesterase